MNGNKQIIFVDDDENVLNGLRRMMRSMRSMWDMEFFSNAQQALCRMENHSCNVIVTDMRMPTMTGMQLLTEVRDRYPAVIRLVLSGQVDRENILSTVGPIHQFIQKPCTEGMLKSIIGRVIQLGDLFANDELRSMVTELETLPSLPIHQQELIDQFRKPDATPEKIGELICKDMAMTMKILQLINSAFFGLRRHVGTPVDAVKLLGIDAVQSLVMTMQVFSRATTTVSKGFSQDALLSHSVEVAVLAKKIAKAEGMHKDEIGQVYLAGLLHDVGKLILADKLPEKYSEAIKLMQADKISSVESEKIVFGASHAEVGGYLLGLWAFDTSVVDAAVYHHSPMQSHAEGFTSLTAVHIANALVRHDQDANDSADLDIDYEYLECIGLKDRLDTWKNTCYYAA